MSIGKGGGVLETTYPQLFLYIQVVFSIATLNKNLAINLCPPISTKTWKVDSVATSYLMSKLLTKHQYEQSDN